MTASPVRLRIKQCGAMYGRLFNVSGIGWCAGYNNISDWLQVDFGKEFYVGAVATQGGRFGFITDFKLLYSNDEGTWQTYQNGNGEELVIWKGDLTSFRLIVESKPCVSSRKLSQSLIHCIRSQTGAKNDQATRRIIKFIEICYCFEFPCLALW